MGWDGVAWGWVGGRDPEVDIGTSNEHEIMIDPKVGNGITIKFLQLSRILVSGYIQKIDLAYFWYFVEIHFITELSRSFLFVFVLGYAT